MSLKALPNLLPLQARSQLSRKVTYTRGKLYLCRFPQRLPLPLLLKLPAPPRTASAEAQYSYGNIRSNPAGRSPVLAAVLAPLHLRSASSPPHNGTRPREAGSKARHCNLFWGAQFGTAQHMEAQIKFEHRMASKEAVRRARGATAFQKHSVVQFKHDAAAIERLGWGRQSFVGRVPAARRRGRRWQFK